MTRSVLRWLLVALFLLQGHNPAFADDTCVFAVTANDVPPNVVFLLDNGAEMEQILWHSGYNKDANYAVGGSVFTNSGGYVVQKSGNKYNLYPIQADLTIGTTGLLPDPESSSNTFTFNGRTITLPFVPSAAVDASGIKDNASRFRYSTNYLNWLFYGPYAGNGSDLPSKSRFYSAKQAIFAVARQTANRAKFGIYSFTSTTNGASNVQPLGMVVTTPLVSPSSSNVLDSSFANNINNMGTVTYSPLAEGLATIGGYFNSPSSGVVDLYCQRNFALVVTPGVSSADLGYAVGTRPSSFIDHDGDGRDSGDPRTLVIDGVSHTIPIGPNGSTWLDDVAHFMATNDMVSYRTGIQYVNTYTVGFMGSEGGRRFLINTSNNGNDNKNLYDSTDPEYGKYHFEAASPEGLAQSLIDALNAILEKTNAFAAPVVPITRTTSGNRLYMSFFTPNSKSIFWEGNVVKLGLNTNLEIVDKNGNLATYPNGALKDTIEPFWATVDWADTTKANGVLNTARNIYSYLGSSTALTNASNQFTTSNASLTAAVLGNPTHTTAQIISYVRGADVFDEDGDAIITENRKLITGDVLHSEPLVHQYIHSSGTLTLTDISGTFQVGENIRGSKGGYATITSVGGGAVNYSALKSPFTKDEQITGLISEAEATIGAEPDVTMIYYGANDGMLHAVRDTNGTEAWGFIPPNQLARLKLMVESTSHQYYVDASPKIYLYDINGNGFIDAGDKVILVSGERKGSTGYFALDVTDPEAPLFLWRINQSSEATSTLPAAARATPVVPQLGESWSEPRFGKVKTSAADTVGTPVFVVGGGYSGTNSFGKAVLVINALTGQPVKIFENASVGTNITAMNYSIPSAVRAMDTDRNGFLDKIYVGDMGGQVWRIGRFDVDELGNDIDFPKANENINDWQGQKLFAAGCNEANCTDAIDNNANGLIDEWRKFFYPPTVTLEVGHDLVLIGSGDRENPCSWFTLDEMYAIRDDHSLLPVSVPPPAAWTRSDLTDVTLSAPLDPSKKGWLFSLAPGEKVLAESTVFAGRFYFTTFTPNNDSCVPGGAATLYELSYNSGELLESIVLGGGIPSRPVVVISDTAAAMFISVGSANPDAESPSTTAAILKPETPPLGLNLHNIWWKEGD